MLVILEKNNILEINNIAHVSIGIHTLRPIYTLGTISWFMPPYVKSWADDTSDVKFYPNFTYTKSNKFISHVSYDINLSRQTFYGATNEIYEFKIKRERLQEFIILLKRVIQWRNSKFDVNSSLRLPSSHEQSDKFKSVFRIRFQKGLESCW